MKFLVRIQVRLPQDLAEPARSDLLGAEQERGRELKAAGTIVDMWRIPGRLENVGIWSAKGPTELHEALRSLPVAEFAEIEVTALARHYLTTDGDHLE